MGVDFFSFLFPSCASSKLRREVVADDDFGYWREAQKAHRKQALKGIFLGLKQTKIEREREREKVADFLTQIIALLFYIEESGGGKKERRLIVN